MLDKIRGAMLTLSLLCILLEDLHDLILPAHVRLLCQILPLFAVGLSYKAAVLGTEAEFGDVAHPLVQEGLVSSADDPNQIRGVGGKRLNGATYAICWNCRTRILDDGSECSIIIEHKQAFLALTIVLEEKRTVKCRRRV